jgi:hypothetical protein
MDFDHFLWFFAKKHAKIRKTIENKEVRPIFPLI